MPRIKLTQRFIERAQSDGPRPAFYRDTDVEGLALKVEPSGGKSFVFEARQGGRVRRMKLGTYPGTELPQAKRRARDHRNAIDEGRVPADEKQLALDRDRTAPTLGDLWAAWLERHAKPFKRSWRQDEGRYKKHLEHWASRRLDSITPADVERLHRQVGAGSGPYEANRVIALLRAMLAKGRKPWAMVTGENAAAEITFFPETKRTRELPPGEATRVLDAIAAESNPYWIGYFRLHLLLSTRRTELLTLRWSDVQFDAIPRPFLKLPGSARKNARELILPLSPPAVAILRSLPVTESPFVFPSYGRTGHLVNPAKAWGRIRARAQVSDLRIHDLRHAVASSLASAGEGLPLGGRVLGHVTPSATARYTHVELEATGRALDSHARRLFGARTSRGARAGRRALGRGVREQQ